MGIKDITYLVFFDVDSNEWVATPKLFSGICNLADTPTKALEGLLEIMPDVLDISQRK